MIGGCFFKDRLAAHGVPDLRRGTAVRDHPGHREDQALRHLPSGHHRQLLDLTVVQAQGGQLSE